MVQSPPRTNPFPGLRPFELDEEHLFFGREGQADELLTRLNRTRFLAVVGTSGSGKSSLVRAGLLPSLYSGLMQNASSGWRVAILRPGSAPMANLAAALNAPDVFGVDPASDDAVIRTALTESTLRRGALGLVEVTQQARMEPRENLLVVVDQFEELFRFKTQAQAQDRRLEAENEAAAFVKLLLGAVGQREVPIFVVLTMRSDFLGDCAQFRDLPETLNDSQYLIPRLTREQLRSAIAGPVAVGGATITPRLVNRLLNDTGDNPDQLPILQHALMRTWGYWEDQGQRERAIDIEHYEEIGGMAEALSRHANQIYANLNNDRERQISETLFRCLTDRGADNREIRRPTQLAEICAVAHADIDEVIAVIDQFRASRRSFLMPPPQVRLQEGSVIDISHESLMRNWQRLKGWVDTEFRSATIYRRLAETAELNQQGQANFLRDPELTIGLTWQKEQQPNAIWAKRYAENFDEAIAFLDASAEAAEAEITEKERARKREVNRLRTFLAALGGLSLLTGGAAVYAFQQQQEAQEQTHFAQLQEQEAKEQRQIAEGQRAIAEEQKTTALEQERNARSEKARAEKAQAEAEAQKQQAEEAEEAETEQRQLAEKALQRAEAGENEANRQTKIANTQTQIAQENAATAKAATVLAEQEKQNAETAALNNSIQADSLVVENLLSSGLHFKAMLSALKLGKKTQSLAQETSPERNISKQIFHKQNSDQYLSQQNLIRPGTLVQAVSVLRESLDRDIPLEKNSFRGHDSQVISVRFSPDGQTIASASQDGSIKVWDSVGNELQNFESDSEEVSAVSFSPDGQTIAAISRVGNTWSIQLWDLDGNKLQTFGASGWIDAVSFSPNGQTIAAASDGTIRLWDLSGNELKIINSSYGSAFSMSFSPDGQILATGNYGGVVELWDVAKGGLLQTLEGHSGAVNSINFSPDGQMIASASDDGTIRLWGTDGRKLETLIGHFSGVNSVQFSPDAQTIISGSSDNTIKAWDLAGRPAPSLKGHAGSIASVEFSPDGQAIVSASRDGSINLWGAVHGNEIQTLRGHYSSVSDVSFSSDGQTIASAGQDSTIKLWGLSTIRQSETVILQVNGQLEPTEFKSERNTFYKEHDFIGHKGEALSIQLTSEDFNTYLIVKNKSGEVLFKGPNNRYTTSYSDASGELTQNSSSELFVEIPEDGIYTALVTSYEPDEIGAYQLKIESAAFSKILEGHLDGIASVRFSPSRQLLASGSMDGTIKLWDITTLAQDKTVFLSLNEQLAESEIFPDRDTFYKEYQFEGYAGQMLSIRLGSEQFDTYLIVKDTAGEIVYENDDSFSSLDSSLFIKIPRDGTYTAVVTSFAREEVGDFRLRIESATFSNILEGNSGIKSLDFSPDGQVLAAGNHDGTIQIWDSNSARELQSFKGHSGVVSSISFSPDGQMIGSAGSDGTIKLWDVSGHNLQILEGHSGGVQSVSFSPDGEVIASTSDDGTVKLWDITGREIQTLEGHLKGVNSLSFAPNISLIASGSDDGTVILWDFDLDSLMARSCDWLRDYMANPATPPEEKALCKDVAPSQPPIQSSVMPGPLHWVTNVRAFLGTAFINPTVDGD